MPLRNDYPKRVGPTTLTGSATVIYTAPTRVRLYYLTLSNFTSGAVTATVYVIPASGSVVNANALVSALSIPANDMISPPVDFPLEQGDTIQALAGSGAAINLTAAVTDQEHV